MKILVLASFAKSLILLRAELLAALVAAGHEVVASAPEAEDRFVEGLSALGVRYQAIALDRTSTNPIRDLAYLHDVIRLLRRERPGILFAYTAKPVIYGSLAAHRAGTPRIFSMITGLGYAFASKDVKQRVLRQLLYQLYRRGLARNEAVFFQNPDDLALFKSVGLVPAERAVLVNGSGVNLERFQPAPPVVTPPTFLLVGRMLRDKGVLEYGAAAGMLKAQHPRAVFRLLGPHDDHPASIPWPLIQEWIDKGILEYYGETEDVRPAMAQAGVYVLPSYREGTPRSVLEAMAMGRPVITTDAPGCRETVVHDRNGFLVKVGDSTGLAQAMERFILNPALIVSMGLESRQIAEAKFDVRLVNSTIIDTMRLPS